MKKLIFPGFALVLAILALQSPSVGGPRGGGGGRGAAASRGGAVAGHGGAAAGYNRGGAVQGYGGGAAGGQRSGGAVVGPAGGAGAGQRSSAGVVGPAGGSAQAGRASGSYTTGRGTTVDYGAAGRARTTPGGAEAGRAVGGVQVTTPGGREVNKVGQAGGVSGPGGRAVGGRESVTAGSGPYGSAATRSQGAAARGPQGGVAAAGSRSGVAAGHGGAVAGGSRSAVAAGGSRSAVAAGGSRGAVAAGGYGVAAGRTTTVARQGTYYRSATTIHNQGVYVRRNVSAYPCFRSTWYTANPSAWYATGWVAGSVWRAATWNSCATYCGIVAEPVYYDYGVNVAYEDDGVYYDGDKLAGQEAYSEFAIELADTGREAKVTRDEEWLSLGVFAMVQGDEKTSNHVFQLAVDKSGVIRGSYYDAVTEASSVVTGSLDRKTQRAAWTVGDRKTPVYEAGFANLTRDETTMIVHYGKDRSSQFSLVRVENPDKLD